VLRGQLDPAARLIWLLEKAGWVSEVRWPTPQRFDARRLASQAVREGVRASAATRRVASKPSPPRAVAGSRRQST